jgi:hypothetical protein
VVSHPELPKGLEVRSAIRFQYGLPLRNAAESGAERIQSRLTSVDLFLLFIRVAIGNTLKKAQTHGRLMAKFGIF